MRIRGSFVLAIAIAATIVFWMASGQIDDDEDAHSEGPAAASADDGQLTSVRVAMIAAQNRDSTLTIRGRTEALRKVTLRAETQGAIVSMPTERGAFVSEGDLICEIATNDRAARLEEARANLALRRAENDAARELGERGFRSDIQRAGALAALNSAQAAFRAAEVDLGRTQITAPFDGILDERFVNVGDYMSPGAPCGVVVDQNPFLIVGQVSERDVSSLQTGALGFGRLIDGTEVQGRIRFIGTQADPSTRTFRVELEVENEDSSLRDGITSNIIVPTRSEMAHQISPAILSLADTGQIGVKLVDDEDIVRFTPIEIVADDGEGFWIRGLPNVARLIIVGHEYVVDGQHVNPVEVSTEVQS